MPFYKWSFLLRSLPSCVISSTLYYFFRPVHVLQNDTTRVFTRITTELQVSFLLPCMTVPPVLKRIVLNLTSKLDTSSRSFSLLSSQHLTISVCQNRILTHYIPCSMVRMLLQKFAFFFLLLSLPHLNIKFFKSLKQPLINAKCLFFGLLLNH